MRNNELENLLFNDRISFGGAASGDGDSGIYGNSSFECVMDSGIAVASTAIAVAAPNPATVSIAAFSWGNAYGSCVNTGPTGSSGDGNGIGMK